VGCPKGSPLVLRGGNDFLVLQPQVRTEDFLQLQFFGVQGGGNGDFLPNAGRRLNNYYKEFISDVGESVTLWVTSEPRS
jgi:hypothetical protein